MRMIRGSGLLSTFFTYKNGSEMGGSTWEETDIEVLGKNDAKTWQSNLITGNPRMTSEQLYSATELARRRLSHVHARVDAGLRVLVVRRRDGQEDRRRPGEQPDQRREPSLQRLGERCTGWAGALDDAALPAYQFVNWIKYYRYDNGQFVLDWTDDFDSLDTPAGRRATGRSTATSSTSIRRTRSFRTAR